MFSKIKSWLKKLINKQLYMDTATSKHLDKLAAQIGISRNYSTLETDGELRERCREALQCNEIVAIREYDPCKCEAIFKNAKDFKLTKKAFRDIETLKNLFEPLQCNQYWCRECGMVYFRDWGKQLD